MNSCVIPARLNSSRFPGKLLARIGGKSVIQQTYECALKAKKIDALFIATDSSEIAEHVEEFGGTVIWTSSNCASGTDRIAEALQKEPVLQSASLIINLQGDHPFTSPDTLDRLVELLSVDPSAPMATAVRPIRTWEEFRSPHVVKCVFDCSGYALYFSRSPIPHQGNSPVPFGYIHIGIYGYRPSFLQQFITLPNSDLQRSEDLEQLKVLEMGYRIKVAVVEDEGIGIDTPEDLQKLQCIMIS